MHTSPLALEAPIVASVAFWALAVIVAYSVYIGYRPKAALFEVVGFLSLCIYFGILGATAGPDPKLSRTDMAVLIRYILIVGVGSFAAYAVLMVGEMRRSRLGGRRIVPALVLALSLILLFG